MKRNLALWTAITLLLSMFYGFCGTASASTDFSVVPASAAGDTEANALVQELVGNGLVYSDAKMTGAAAAFGVMNGGASTIGFNDGIVLSTGTAAGIVGPNVHKGTDPNNPDFMSKEYNTSGVSELDTLAGATTKDGAVLEFTFVPESDHLYFEFVFSSDEYNEYIDSEYNDAFGFFVNGENVANIGTDPITINTVNGSKNSGYFIDNTDAHLDTEMDGLTTVIRIDASVIPNVPNTMKIAIADGGDAAADSNVIIKSGSMSDQAPPANHAPTVSIDHPSVDQAVNGSGSVSISGTASDTDNDDVTVSAAVYGVTKTASATGGTWTLTWDVAADSVGEGSYANIEVSASDGNGGTAAATYTGTITVDMTAPTVTSAGVYRANPNKLVVRFSEPVSLTNAAGFTVNVGGQTVAIDAVSGGGTNELTFTLHGPVSDGQTVTLSYASAGGNAADTAGNQLADVVSQAVTNNLRNVAPVVSAITKTGQADRAISFTAADFTGAYQDADSNALHYIKIVSLPDHGVLWAGTAEVEADDEVAFSELASLKFVPTAGWSGTTSFQWKASDGTDLSLLPATVTLQVTAIPTPAPSTSTPEAPAASPAQVEETGVEIIVNGKIEEKSATATVSHNDGKSTVTVAIDPTKLDEKLRREGTGAVVVIPVKRDYDAVVGELNGQMVKNMENHAAVLEIQTLEAAYTLPANEINIDAISGKLGTADRLQDIKIRIEIAASSDAKARLMKDSAAAGGFAVVASPLDFTVTATYGGRQVEVSRFNAYVERRMRIPDGVDPAKITTGIVLEPNGNIRHVPTKVVQEDGNYYAIINSLTNSTYSVIWHPKTFEDVEKHWSRAYANEMGSRLVVEGMDDSRFAPDKAISRAEFAAILVRALGLKEESGQANGFKDVKTGDWFADSVNTAFAYGLMTGYPGNDFLPGRTITREEAMVAIVKALKLAGHPAATKAPGASNAALAKFIDAEQFSAWAQSSAEICVASGIVQGDAKGMARPKAVVTRAETAKMVMDMLQTARLI
ncbi:choice-of-anchor L domain-containing protein [Cohnella caldifontis]|uniref:choice-of-anchor L domain-containing protein n=1 Tax=Cohnella caldifontis TaxID=3027471 RepID=UPI0023EDED67|nr:choice-of-anchor L domain-containing protein [Cohnella sp. YIM B05605]